MVTLSKLKKHERVADLGSGDGRIAIAFAKEGAEVDAYELDEKLIKLSQENAQQKNVSERITFHKKNFWGISLTPYDVITIYPMPDVLEGLEKKLGEEMRKGSRALLNFYPLPHWKHSALKDHIYLYIK